MEYTLKSLVSNFNRNLSDYKNKKLNYNEHATRSEYIDPLLKLLGWDIENTKGVKPNLREVIPENYISMGSRPDYTFTVGGVKKFFIEAKKPSVDITNNNEAVLQARRYGFSAKHYITVLTNFEYLLIYDATVFPDENDQPHVALIGEYHYEDYERKWNEIKSLISREAVFNGDLETNFKQIINHRTVKTVDDYFVEQINGWRLKLANYLYSEKQGKLSIEKINDVIQRFINQMIFLRICEDRNLPIYHKLQETITDKTLIREKLFEVLKEADKKYNSGLFEPNDDIVLDLSNEIIYEMIEELYYPKSPYIFNVIDSNILGEIYESFLSEKLSLENQEIKLVKVKKSKKNKEKVQNRDIVSTPNEIVKFMVKNALTPLIKGKTPDDILELKFADISCGSGVFLVEMFSFIQESIRDWYVLNGNFSYLIEGENGVFHLPFEIKKRILISCIYGIDIDQNAVEVAQFSLLLKLLENETEPSLNGMESVLPILDSNIMQGNSLIDNQNLNSINLSQENVLKICPFDWYDTKYDAIIGNPPYVKTEDMRAFTPKKEYDVYLKEYTTSYKQFDKYYIFVERALSRLKEDGVLSFIIPNKFSKIDSGEKLRELISTFSVKEFIDFGSTQIFKEKNVITYSSILTIVNSKPEEDFYFEEVNNINLWWKYQNEKQSSLKRISLKQNLLTNDIWLLVASDIEWQLIRKLYENSMLIGDKKYFEAVNGIQTSAESPPVYSFKLDEITDQDESFFFVKRNDKIYPIEKSIVKPYFKPRRSKKNNIQSYDIVEPKSWIIFPYDQNGKIFTQDVLENRFEKTWRYLNDFYERLLPKQFSKDGKGRDVPHATEDTWYHYGRNQAFKLFNNTPKIIIGVNTHISNPLNLLDKNDMVIASGGTAGYCAITLAQDSPYALEYIHAVLNHPAIVWLCSVMGSDFEGDFYSRGTYVLNKLPIRKIDFNNNREVMYYNQIIEKTKEVDSININLQNLNIRKQERIQLERRKNVLIKGIQDCVTKLYDIEHLMQYFNKDGK